MSNPVSKRITLKDVALRAGVATGTVSMVLNGSSLVAERTRAHVQMVIRDMGYIYDRAAGNLRNKHSKIVGVSICDLLNPYFANVLAGVQEAADSSGRVSVLSNCAESASRQLKFLHTLREYNVEGLLLTPVYGTPRLHVEQLLEWGIPVVQVTRAVAGTETDYVGNDNRLATQMATSYLQSLGHERIAYIGHTGRTSTGRDRFAGYRKVLKNSGQTVKDDWVIECPVSREGGFDAVIKLFEEKNPPTALLCFNDLIAFGAMLGLARLGIRPGHGCSVIGIDNDPEGKLWQPSLASIAVDSGSIGREAIRLLTQRIKNPDHPIERVILRPTLVPGSSCGPAPSPQEAKRRAL